MNFTEISFVVAAMRARDLSFLDVLPSVFPTENGFNLLLLKSYFLGNLQGQGQKIGERSKIFFVNRRQRM